MHLSALRTSGTLPRHYAPATPLELGLPDALEEPARHPVAVLSRRLASGMSVAEGFVRRVLAPRRDPEGYSRMLYTALQEPGQSGAESIRVEELPRGVRWLAVRDRLRRSRRSRRGGGR
jgi:L-threonylcarbamoyladenylate synthase